MFTSYQPGYPDGMGPWTRFVSRFRWDKFRGVTMFEEDHLVFAAMRAGARGSLLKGATREDIVRAIRAVGSGDTIFSSEIVVKLVDDFGALHPVSLRRHFRN